MHIMRKGLQHVVTDDNGKEHGTHNSVWSAARQVHEYFRAGGEGVGGTPVDNPMHAERGTAAQLRRPTIPRPGPNSKPIPHAKIPRPKK